MGKFWISFLVIVVAIVIIYFATRDCNSDTDQILQNLLQDVKNYVNLISTLENQIAQDQVIIQSQADQIAADQAEIAALQAQIAELQSQIDNESDTSIIDYLKAHQQEIIDKLKAIYANLQKSLIEILKYLKYELHQLITKIIDYIGSKIPYDKIQAIKAKIQQIVHRLQNVISKINCQSLQSRNVQSALSQHYSIFDTSTCKLKAKVGDCPVGTYGDSCQYKMCNGGTISPTQYDVTLANKYCGSFSYGGINTCDIEHGVCSLPVDSDGNVDVIDSGSIELWFYYQSINDDGKGNLTYGPMSVDRIEGMLPSGDNIPIQSIYGYTFSFSSKYLDLFINGGNPLGYVGDSQDKLYITSKLEYFNSATSDVLSWAHGNLDGHDAYTNIIGLKGSWNYNNTYRVSTQLPNPELTGTFNATSRRYAIPLVNLWFTGDHECQGELGTHKVAIPKGATPIATVKSTGDPNYRVTPAITHNVANEKWIIPADDRLISPTGSSCGPTLKTTTGTGITSVGGGYYNIDYTRPYPVTPTQVGDKSFWRTINLLSVNSSNASTGCCNIPSFQAGGYTYAPLSSRFAFITPSSYIRTNNTAVDSISDYPGDVAPYGFYNSGPKYNTTPPCSITPNAGDTFKLTLYLFPNKSEAPLSSVVHAQNPIVIEQSFTVIENGIVIKNEESFKTGKLIGNFAELGFESVKTGVDVITKILFL
jgi:hypothetical protein